MSWTIILSDFDWDSIEEPRQILNWFVVRWQQKWSSFSPSDGAENEFQLMLIRNVMEWWRRPNIQYFWLLWSVVTCSTSPGGQWGARPGHQGGGGDNIPGPAPASDNSLVNTDSQYQHLAPVICHSGVISPWEPSQSTILTRWWWWWWRLKYRLWLKSVAGCNS